jgi:hypothetical protein
MSRSKPPVFRFVASCTLPISEGLSFHLSHDQVTMTKLESVATYRTYTLFGTGKTSSDAVVVSANTEKTYVHVHVSYQNAG